MSQGHAFPLQRFIASFSDLLDGAPTETVIIRDGGELLRRLVARDEWLPNRALGRTRSNTGNTCCIWIRGSVFRSSVSCGRTPIHNHTVWGLIGMLRGAEYAQRYVIGSDGLPQRDGEPARLVAGAVDAVSPTIGDLHQVSNAWSDRVSIGIHVYGANIGAIERSAYDGNGERRRFVSGYSGGLQTGDAAAL